MKIVYHCYGGAHSSVTAAAIHLGWLPAYRLPQAEELKRIPYFDGPRNKDHGQIKLMGIDEFNNEIYVLGRRNTARIFENMAKGLIEVFDMPSESFVFVNVMPYVNWKMVLGGFTSRKLGWAGIGRPIIIAGVRYSYRKIGALVTKVKKWEEK